MRLPFQTHHILINIDIEVDAEMMLDDKDSTFCTCSSSCTCLGMCSNDTPYHGEDSHPRRGLLFLLYKKVYKDAFVLHDETEHDPYELEEIQVEKPMRLI